MPRVVRGIRVTRRITGAVRADCVSGERGRGFPRRKVSIDAEGLFEVQWHDVVERRPKPGGIGEQVQVERFAIQYRYWWMPGYNGQNIAVCCPSVRQSLHVKYLRGSSGSSSAIVRLLVY